jgi:hypothetical protein
VIQALLLLHSIRGCKTLDSLSLEGNGFVKRDAHRKRKRQNEKCYSDGVAPSEPSVIERAGANAFALLLGGALDCNDLQLQSTAAWLGPGEAGAASASFLAYAAAAKPLRVKELCLKCEGSYVFGTHIITAAVQSLAKPHAHLQMLDVTGNECGDALAQVLGDVLPKNKSLQALFWDGNCITVDGFLQFYDGLLKNRTLVMVQMPIQDTRRVRGLAMCDVRGQTCSSCWPFGVDSGGAKGPATREALQHSGQDLQSHGAESNPSKRDQGEELGSAHFERPAGG